MNKSKHEPDALDAMVWIINAMTLKEIQEKVHKLEDQPLLSRQHLPLEGKNVEPTNPHENYN